MFSRRDFIVSSPLQSTLCIPLGFVYRFAAVYGFGKPGKSAAAAAVTLTTQGEMCTTKTKKPFGNYSWFFPQSWINFYPHSLNFFGKKCRKLVQFRIFSVKIRQIFTHGYSYNNQNIPTWINLLDWSSYMHISPCVVNVMAAAAADFPGFPKPYTAANLETKPSEFILSASRFI